MDDNATDSLENVTQSFLGEQFSDSMEVGEVTVLNQTLVETENGRKLQGLESSPTSSLLIQLGVEGTVTDWQALESKIEDSSNTNGTLREANSGSIEDSISMAIEDSITSNYYAFSTQLGESSDFFPYESTKMPTSKAGAIAAPQESSSNRNQIMLFFVGGFAGLVLLVGSKFYIDRSGSKRKQLPESHHDEEGGGMDQQSAYDLNDLDNGAMSEHQQEANTPARKSVHSDFVEDEVVDVNVCGPCPGGGLGNTPDVDCGGKSKAATVMESRMTSLLDNMDSAETEEKQEISALDMSPDALKAAIKKKENNIYVFTDGKREASYRKSNSGGGDELEIRPSVSSLSNPSQIEEMMTPGSTRGYLGDHFNYTNVEKMIGDQYDTRAIMTPFAPKSNSGNATPSRSRTSYSFSSPVSVKRTQTSRKDKLFDVYAPPGPLGIIIDTTPEGPMIHSLKPTSQLLGLVNPGDLIVGLDGVDTRNMTAATFTRLMAKRSQGERKITLLKGLSPLTPRAANPRE